MPSSAVLVTAIWSYLGFCIVVLFAGLQKVDPELVAAARIEPRNSRRVVRALEVVTLTGRPFTASLPEPAYVVEGTVQVGVRIPRPVLDERIERRVREMWDAGLVAEVRFIISPSLVGGGLSAWPSGVRASFRTVETRQFENGSVFLRYRLET